MRTERPSQTARKVALNIVTLGSKRGMEDVLPPGIVDATVRLLVESGSVGPRVARFALSRMAVGINLAFDWIMPGQFEAFAYRKAFCERQVRRGLEAGARQVLVLGAGFDTLGWRLAPEFPGIDFFEIDHPSTAWLKAKGIAAMERRANLHLLAEDLGERKLVDVLLAHANWDATAPTVIVAEGLFMYLPPEAVGTLLAHCAAVTGAGSHLAFTYVGTRVDGRPDAGPWTWLVARILEANGEPWLWSVRPENLGAFLKEHHWTPDPNPEESSDRRGFEFF
jgi:methyltransferase (TIGR00027 family)